MPSTISSPPKVYLDLDGVMADFDAGFVRLFGRIPHHDMTDAEWAIVHADGDFFETLPLCQGAMGLFNSLPADLSVLTACPRSNYQDVARQKRNWVRKHLGQHVTVLPVLGSHNKPLFMHSPGDILIDDYGKNCREWQAAGGIAIKHEGVLSTIQQFKEHYK